MQIASFTLVWLEQLDSEQSGELCFGMPLICVYLLKALDRTLL